SYLTRNPVFRRYPARLSVQPLNDGCRAQAASTADRLESIASAATFQFIEQRGHQPGTTRAQRMAQGNCTAIDVQPIVTDAGFMHPGQRNSGKSLIDFKQINIVDAEPSLFQTL